MSTSNREAAEDALLALILADPVLQTVGPPQLWMPVAMKKEHVWISENSDLARLPHITGATPDMVTRREDFDIRVICSVEKTGTNYAVIRDRGKQFTGALEDIVRLHHDLAGTVYHSEVSEINRRSAPIGDRQMFVDHEVVIAVTAFVGGWA